MECIQSWVIPASLDETRDLLITRWEVAIILELLSTLWVDPESPRSSLFRMTDVAAFFKVVVIIRLVIKRLFFLDLDEPHQRGHSS